MPSDCSKNPWCSEGYNATQLQMMRAFRNCGVTNVLGLSFPESSCWHNPRLFNRGKRSLLEPGIVIWELPFLALGPMQILSQAVVCAWQLLGFGSVSRPDAILVSSPITRIMVPALLAAVHWNVPLVILAADLTPPAFEQNIFRRLQLWLRQETIRYAPRVVVFSNHLGRDLRSNRRWLRMVRPPSPGLLDAPVAWPEARRPIAYYAGMISESTGAGLFLQSISHVQDPNCRFWFSGRGPLDEAVRRTAEQDHRITHWGNVDHEQYRKLLQKASVLINPRPTHLTENRYNFPGKLMDYMAAGRPIISTASSDISEQYLGAFILLEPETPQRLAELIQKVCQLSTDEATKLGLKARAYVEGENWEAQAQRVLDFLADQNG